MNNLTQQERAVSTASKSGGRMVLTIINTALCGLMILGSFGLVLVSVMANDSGKGNNTLWSLLILFSLALPVVSALSIIFTWIGYKKNYPVMWLSFLVLPWIDLLAVIVLFILFFS